MRNRHALTAITVVAVAALLAATPAVASDDSGTSDSIATTSTTDGAGGEIAPMDAIGCTAAPGGFGATVCMTVLNPTPIGGVVLDESTLEYVSPGDNVCNQQAQWKYMRRLGLGYEYHTQTSNSCGWGAWSQTWDPEPDLVLQHSWDICGRVRNSATSQQWTNWVCKTIIA